MSAPVAESAKVETPKPSPAPPFTYAEQEIFHSEDRHAATAIACIIVTILMAALIGYLCIAFMALSGPS